MSTTPSPPPIAPMPRPKAWRINCRPTAGRTMQAELEALAKALENPARPRRGGGRRRQGLDQARSARQSDQEGRFAGHRRRHGQHLPGRAGQEGRQVAVRTRSARHRARDHDKAAAANKCQIVLPVDAVVAQRVQGACALACRRRRSRRRRRHDPRRRPEIGRGSRSGSRPAARPWCGTARSALSR